jgi:hypothetical protein
MKIADLILSLSVSARVPAIFIAARLPGASIPVP